MMRKISKWIAAAVCLSVVVSLGVIHGCESSSYMGVVNSDRTAMPMVAEAESRVLHAGQPGIVQFDRENDGQNTRHFVVQPGEELWIISKHDAQGRAASDEESDIPGSGALVVPPPPGEEDKQPVPVPLKHTDVQANILGYIATVDVTQQFHNPFSSKIEAVYVFPLPQDAAVNEFVMQIGERKIRGIVREREEAQRLYDQARAQGYNAALLSQERPNIFTQKVANIEPGKSIDVHIRYFHTLRYEDGFYEFVFPMVVGPRFNPSHSADPIHALPRRANSQGNEPAGKHVRYLRPNERSGHDISLAVNINAGVAVEELQSVNHKVQGDLRNEQGGTVAIAQEDSIPNKDFVLRYRVAGERIKGNVMVHRDEDGEGYFTMMLFPPADLQTLERRPMELVFVLDCSGSMSGRPIEQAKDAIRHGLRLLDPQDTFQIIRFSNNASTLGPRPLIATRNNIGRGMNYVNTINGRGGTQMIEGIKASLGFPYDDELERQRIVVFLTDGFIGNESDILGAIHDNLGPARIFSFGVGSSPNRYLMNRMAMLGQGAAAYLSLNDDPREPMEAFFNRLAHPALTDVNLDFGEMRAVDVYPARTPDLFVGRPVIVTGRFQGEIPRSIEVNGFAAGREVAMNVPVTVGGHGEMAAVKPVWARLKIKELATRQTFDNNPELEQAITGIALRHQLVSAYTSFLAVDASRRTEGNFGTTVDVAVPVPDGVRYGTTVGEGDGRQPGFDPHDDVIIVEE